MLDPSTQALELPDSLPPKPRITHRMSSTCASRLFISQSEKLNEKQKQHIDQIRARDPEPESAYQLGQDFVMLLAERREADLDTQLIQAVHSDLPEFKKMANGIRLDYAVIKAAFSSEQSNGLVDAQVN